MSEENFFSEISGEQWIKFCSDLEKNILKKDERFAGCALNLNNLEIEGDNACLSLDVLFNGQNIRFETLVFNKFNCQASIVFDRVEQKQITRLWREFLLGEKAEYAQMLQNFKQLRINEIDNLYKQRLADANKEFDGLLN